MVHSPRDERVNYPWNPNLKKLVLKCTNFEKKNLKPFNDTYCSTKSSTSNKPYYMYVYLFSKIYKEYTATLNQFDIGNYFFFDYLHACGIPNWTALMELSSLFMCTGLWPWQRQLHWRVRADGGHAMFRVWTPWPCPCSFQVHGSWPRWKVKSRWVCGWLGGFHFGSG